MDIPVHDEIIWRACHVARARLAASGTQAIADPVTRFPILSRGSWMNDTNQVTVFSDAVKGTNPTVSDKMKLFFQELWRLDLGNLIEEMNRGDRVVAATAATLAESVTDAREFGAYITYDHLDILRDDPASEYHGVGADLRAATVSETLQFVHGRIQDCTNDKDAETRLDGRRLTVLGRALHTLSDFYAHTNFVELLLWELARRKLLDPMLVSSFNGRGEPFAQTERHDFQCALPLSPADVPRQNAILWYGQEPGVTPLVSSVFDTKDTACSLLSMYAAQLEREGSSSPTDDQMNLVLAVFDVPGRPLVEAGWRLFEGARDLLEGLGRAARGWLADRIEELGTRYKELEDVTATTAALVREYDSAEAAEWARAGRFRYVVHAFARDIAAGLREQNSATKLLPHHTLLNKDHPPETAEDRLRYSLACLFATEVCAEMIEAHFSVAPAAGRYDEVRNRWLAHPALLLGGTKPSLDPKRTAEVVSAAYGFPWRKLSESTPGILS